MHPGVTQIMLGLLCIVGGILIVKALDNNWGLLVFLLGVVLGCTGGIGLSQSGAKEIGN
jgi:hypothetical protein